MQLGNRVFAVALSLRVACWLHVWFTAHIMLAVADCRGGGVIVP